MASQQCFFAADELTDLLTGSSFARGVSTTVKALAADARTMRRTDHIITGVWYLAVATFGPFFVDALEVESERRAENWREPNKGKLSNALARCGQVVFEHRASGPHVRQNGHGEKKAS
jgi:hypothetical protein